MYEKVDFFVNENRFLALMNERYPGRPHWLVKAVRANPEWDVRGIDAFVYVLPVHGTRAIKVPVQVLGRKNGRRFSAARHYEKYPLLVGVCVTVRVHKGLTDEHVRSVIYTACTQIREVGLNFDPFLREYIRMPLPGSEESAHALKSFRKKFLPEANPWLRR